VILFIALTLLLQQPEGVVPCFDRCGNLSADDQRQIARAAATEGTPWLATGRPGLILGYVWVLLQPDTATPQLRPGRYVEVSVYTPGTNQFRIAGVANVWRRVAGQSGRYAQMVSPDRDADDVRGRTDINRPFTVVGTFTDEELISVAESSLIRTVSKSSPAPSQSPIDSAVPIRTTRTDQRQFGCTDRRSLLAPTAKTPCTDGEVSLH